MEKTIITLGVLCILATTAISQDVSKDDEKGITLTTLNYAEGYYSGSGERMAKALSNDLMKFAPMKIPNYDKTSLIQSTYSSLVEASAAKLGFIEEDNRKLETKVLLVDKNIGLSKLTSSQFNDYLQMVRMGDEWKIVNVLWTFGADSRNRNQVPDLSFDQEKPRIIAAVGDYVEGMMLTDGDRVKKVLHPRFTQASARLLPQTDKIMIQRDGSDFITALAYAGLAKQDVAEAGLEISIIDYMDGLTMVKATTKAYTMYLQLAWLDGDWKIINGIN